MTFRSTKTFPPISCAFRQHRAQSHCRFLHGYALEFRIEFEAEELDENNWVVDFGSLKSLRDQIEEFFDHKTVVAEDDPEDELFNRAHSRNLLRLSWLPQVGCEAFARKVFDMATHWLIGQGLAPRVWVAQVECSEHKNNSALFINPTR